jgi:2-dehydro-3-deoxyphosphogluconate aldolase / (4S)-4-hydroxy-2-oxoglutarate aldolase
VTPTAQSTMLNRIGAIGVVPVVTIEQASRAPDLARALADGGIACMEITLRTGAALDAIRAATQEFPDMAIGAGTVLSIEQAREALDAGAQFLVSPGYDDEFVAWCQDNQVLVLPGVATPTEILTARKRGLRVVKFFPADVYGGPKAIKTLSDPFADMRFLPTGGINLTTLADYLKLPSIHACGGSWMASKSLISNGAFDEIRRLARASIQLVSEARAGRGR